MPTRVLASGRAAPALAFLLVLAGSAGAAAEAPAGQRLPDDPRNVAPDLPVQGETGMAGEHGHHSAAAPPPAPSADEDTDAGMDHSGMDHSGHGHHKMTLDPSGMVMNWNEDELPRDCDAVSADHEFTVHVGTDYAADYPGSMFGMSQHEFRVEPCSRVSVTLINEDEVRHQFMVHGLPRYLYPQGMFHLEATGGATKAGSFIVPSDDRTYLVHCDLAQHMEKGMKGQLVVGAGNGDLPSIPGVSAPVHPDDYGRDGMLGWWALLGGFAAGLLALPLLRRL